MAREERFLARWARRKAATRQAAKTKSAGQSLPEEALSEEEKGGNSSLLSPHERGRENPEAVREALDLPDPQSLDRDSDYTVFLREGVPEELKRLALRRLWDSDPIFGEVDGLLEYGEDFSDSALVVEGLRTAYETGRGYREADEEEMPPGESGSLAEEPVEGEEKDLALADGAKEAAREEEPPEASSKNGNEAIEKGEERPS